MKIAIFSHSLSRSGAPKVAIELANWLSKMGDSVTIIHPLESSNEIADLISSKVKIKSLAFRSEGLLKQLLDFIGSNLYSGISPRRKRFNRLLKEVNPDVVLVNTFYWAVISKWLWSAGVPSIRYLHERSFFLNRLSKREIRWIAKSDLVISASPSTRLDAEQYSSWRVDKRFFPHPAPAQFGRPPRHFVNVNRSEPSIVSVGFPRERKGFDYIERAINKTSKTICVHGNHEKETSDNEQIRLMGSGPIDWASYDLLLVLSVSEPWGIVAIEAAHHGVYVVGWGSIDSLIELEKYNLASTFEYGDVDSIATFIQSWSVSDEHCGTYYERFASNFTETYIYGGVREILRSISSESDYSQ